MKKYKIGIVGASGYTGNELIRLLENHPHAELAVATSRPNAGKKVREVFPSLSSDITFTEPDAELNKCDLVFSALPQTKGFDIIGSLIDSGVKVVDLSADFRFDNLKLYEATYGVVHTRPDLLGSAVYGLTEVNRNSIKSAQLLANPGCFVTSALLPLTPVKDMLDRVIIDSASGVSGAGRKADEAYAFCELMENFKPYGVFTHRHAPEISEKLGGLPVTFTPHLLPVKRGILSTIYIHSNKAEEIERVLKSAYANEPFVEYTDTLPELKQVVGTNKCRFACRRRDDEVIVFSAIDNLLKGASGQAMQNMNLMLGLDETEGLSLSAPI